MVVCYLGPDVCVCVCDYVALTMLMHASLGYTYLCLQSKKHRSQPFCLSMAQ